MCNWYQLHITHYKLTIESTALKLEETPASGAVFLCAGTLSEQCTKICPSTITSYKSKNAVQYQLCRIY